MSVTTKKKVLTSATANPYLFDEMLDGFLYLVAFLALPLYSVVDGIRKSNGGLLFAVLSCCFCTFYDSYSRYDQNSGKTRKMKIYIIGGIYFALFLYLILDLSVLLNENHILCPYVYGLLAAAPIVGVVDLINMIKDDILARR